MRLVVYADIHCFGPSEFMSSKQLIESIKLEIKLRNIVILLGDIVDRVRCTSIEAADKFYQELLELVNNYRNIYFVSGNHEGTFERLIKFIKFKTSSNIILHGDLALNKKKYSNYRIKTKEVSKNFFKILKLKSFLLQNYPFKRLTKKNLKKIEKHFARPEFRTDEQLDNILIGHLHPVKLEKGIIKYNNQEITVWCFPQGITSMPIEKLCR